MSKRLPVRNENRCPQRDSYRNVHCSLFTGAHKWENPSGRIKEPWYSQTRGTALQKDGMKDGGGDGSEHQTH